MAITLTDNEFFTGLTNLALFQKLYATNTSKMADDFVDSFATETLSFGNKKLFHFSDLPEVDDYSGASSLLTVSKADVTQEEITITEKKVIKSSYSALILEGAFTDEKGMNNFIGYIMGQMESAKTDHLYDVIVADLFSKTFTGTNQNKVIQLLNPTGVTSATELNNINNINYKRIAVGIQEEIQNMQVYSTGYTKSGFKTALDLSDLKMVLNAHYNNDEVVEIYASLLNSEYIDKAFAKPELKIIPKIKIDNADMGVIGFAMHKKAYQWFYKFTFMGSFFDTSNLVVNNFMHFWYGKGWLDELPCVKFTFAVQ